MLLENAVQFEIAVERELVRMGGNRDEIVRQRFNVAELSRNSQQKILVEVIEARERTNGVACVGANAEFVDSPDVDGDAHSLV